MKTNRLRDILLAGTIVSGLFVAAPAVAQTAAAAPAASDEGEVVVVTGSRIARRDGSAESPILTVGAEDIVQSGAVAVEAFLNTLPQVTAGLSSQSNNPSSNGRAFIDLRGLGQSRNLVLLDGRRAMGSTSGGVVDVNTIPAALISRAEIITGGAATTYGSDAVSGVVNFILKDNFEGVAYNTQFRRTEIGDGDEFSADLTIGGNFEGDRGNAVISISYYDRADIYKDGRAFAAQAQSATGSYPGGAFNPGTNAPSTAAVAGVFGPGACADNGGIGGFGFNPNGSLFCTGVANDPRNIVGYTGPQEWIATAFAPDYFSYNFEPDNLLVLPMTRWSMFANVRYDVNEHFKPFARVMYTNYNALQELAPTPAAGTTGFTVPTTNPFITPQLATLLASRPTPGATFSFSKRFNDLGGRTGFNTHDVWQAIVGSTGDIVEDWTYDVHASYGRSVINEIQGGNVRRDRVQNLINGATVAAQNTLSGGACPNGLNLFGNAPIDPSCARWISLEAKNLTVADQTVIEATVNGTLFNMPAGPVQSVFGASYRGLNFDFKPDGGLQPGVVAGFNEQLPVSGSLTFFDFFTEVNVPLLKDLPFIQDLGVTLGLRYTDSDPSGASTTYKATGEWTVFDSLRVRGGYQTAIRSPNINELFDPRLNNFPTFTNQDPCNASGANAATYRLGPNGARIAALCATQSAVAGGAAFFQPAGQATGIVGGNLDLKPEEANSITLGVVFRPDEFFVPRFQASLDYWNVEIEQYIAAFAAATIVQRCYNRDGANPTYSPTNPWCQLFTRDPANGGVVNLVQQQRNENYIATDGFDLTLNFGFDALGGALDFNVVTTYVSSYESGTTVSPSDPIYEYVGTIGSLTASAIPQWRSTIQANYQINDLEVRFTSRFIDEMVHNNTVTGGSAAANTPVESTWYFDLSGQYALSEMVTLRAGVNNLLDEEPQVYTPSVQANTDPSTYDVLGRRYFVGVGLRF